VGPGALPKPKYIRLKCDNLSPREVKVGLGMLPDLNTLGSGVTAQAHEG
jgi:hypothetical protein